jgi:uncharacterized GH25 family protein
MKKSILLLSLCILSVFAMAHEFWLSPSTWFVQIGQRVRVQLCVGEGFHCEPWEAGPSRVVQFASLLKKTRTDRLPALQKSGLDSLWLTFEQPGTHLVTLMTNGKFIELEADKFDAYLQEDGLEHIREMRRNMGLNNKSGREMYRREAATLIQVGNTPTTVFFKKTGFDLQILPEKNPLLADANADLTFQIKFKGKKLAGALVRHWHKKSDGEAIVQFQKTDKQGRVRFRLNAGEQMVSVVHMLPYPVPAEADWQSVWGNLTFNLR